MRGKPTTTTTSKKGGRGSRRRRRPDDQGESGRKPNESKKGRLDERLAPQPEADAEDGDD